MLLNGSPTLVLRLAVAALGGLAVGIEREWSEKRRGHSPHFAGPRTFLLLGLLGALGSIFLLHGLAIVGAALTIAGAALVVVAYGITSRHSDVGCTTLRMFSCSGVDTSDLDDWQGRVDELLASTPGATCKQLVEAA